MRALLRDRPGVVVGGLLGLGGLMTCVLWATRGVWAPGDLGGLNGLFDYPSAYLGDVILLPIAAGGLMTLCSNLDVSPLRRPGLIAGAVGLGVGLTTQALWLADPSPGLNWTLPEPHHFNLAGWWHLAYLVGASAIFASLGWTALLAVRDTLRGGRREIVRSLVDGPGAIVTLGSLLGFALLAARDSSPRGLASATSLTAITVATVVVALAGSWVIGRDWRWFAGWFAWSFGWAAWSAVMVLLCFAILPGAADKVDRGWELGLATSVLSAVAAGVLVTYEDRPNAFDVRTGWHVVAVVMVLGPALALTWGLLATFAQTESSLRAMLIWFAVGPIAGGVLRWLRTSDVDLRANRSVLFSVWSLGAVTLLAASRDWADLVTGPAAEIGVVGVIAFLTGVLYPPIKGLVEGLLQRAPDPDTPTKPKDDKPPRNAAADKGFLFLAAIAAAMALASLAFSTLIARQATASGAEPRDVTSVPLLAILVILITSGGAWLRRPAAGLVILLWPVGLFALDMVGLPRDAPGVPGNSATLVLVLVVAASLIYAAWTLNSVLGNVVLLRGAEMTPIFWIVSAACGLSSAVTGYVAATAALGPTLASPYPFWVGLLSALFLLLVNCFVVAAAAYAAAPVVAHESDRDPDDFSHSVSAGLAQDGVLFGLLFLIAAVFPTQAAMFSIAPELWARIATSFTVASPMLTLFVRVFIDSTKLNKNHARNVIKKSAKGEAFTSATKGADTNEHHAARLSHYWYSLRRPVSDRESNHERLILLHAHCANQNLLAYVFTAATLFGALVLVGERE